MLTFRLIFLAATVLAIRRPNFLFVIVDDLRPALGCYGDSKAHTPSIDRLARRGFIFEQAYAQQALCAPSRNSLLTSRRPDTIGLYDFYSYWREVAGNYTTLPQHLRNNGYTTVSMGKVFHPGASCNYSDDAPYSWSKQPFHPNSERYKNAPICSSGSRLPANNLICPVRVSSMPNGTLPDIETLNAAKDFLTTKLQEPFFLAVGFHKPHIPLKYPKKYLKFHPLEKFPLPKNYAWPSNVSKVAYNPWMDLRQRSDVAHLGLQCPWQKIPKNYAKKVIQSYYAAVTYVDNLIGKLLDQLEIVKISNNTIVVLTSDHGWSLGEHAEWAKYSNFDVSLRVPLIISIPEIDKKLKLLQECSMKKYYSDHKIVQEPVELLDIFPTIAELAGIPVIDCPRRKINRKITLCTEGSSLIPLIETSSMCKSVPWKGIAVSQYPRPSIEPICKPSSDKPRLRDIKIMGYTLRVSKYRYTAWISFSHISKTPNWQKILAEELYDHSIDFEENSNLANLERFQSLKHDLKSLLMKNF